MPVYTRDQLPSLLQSIGKNDIAPVYLIRGDRFLTQEASRQIEEALSVKGGTIHPIDGEQEDISSTVARLRSYSLLPGRQIYRVSDTRIFHSRNIAKSIWNRAVKAQSEGKNAPAADYLRAFLEAGGLDPFDAENDPAELNSSTWQQAFGFAKPAGNLNWTGEALRLIARQDDPKYSQKEDAASLLADALATGIPSTNILILLTEEADRRKQLYKFLKEQYVILDLSVDTGASVKAQKEQKTVLSQLIKTTLSDFDKTMSAPVIDALIERIGFFPVAAVMETEKLALSVGDRREITREDLDELVGRTRQDALFELTGALGSRHVHQALLILDRILENGIHALAVVATLRNYTRTLLLFRALQDNPAYGYMPTMSAASFQQTCLPGLKKNDLWKKELLGHPYALYMQFKTAAAFKLSSLQAWMRLLARAELRLKGSPVDPKTVLHHLLLSMFRP